MARPEGEGSVSAEQTRKATPQKEQSVGFWGSIVNFVRRLLSVFSKKSETPRASEGSPKAEVAMVTPTENPEKDVHEPTGAPKSDNDEAVPVAEPVVVKPTEELVVEHVEQPAANPAAELVEEPAGESVGEPAGEPAARPAAELKEPEISASQGAPATSPEVPVLSPEGNESSVPAIQLSKDDPDEKQAAASIGIVAPHPAAETKTETQKPEEAVELKANDESVSEPSAAASVDQSTVVNSDNIEPDAKLNEVSDNIISIDG